MTYINTFVPFQTHNQGWGINGWNQNPQWGFGGLQNNSSWNQSPLWGQNPSWNQSPLWGQAPGWSQGGWNPNSTWNLGSWNQMSNTPAIWGATPEFNQGITQGSQVAFVPHQGGFSGGSFIPGNTSAMPTTVTGIQWNGGQQNILGVSQSFATELAENNQEYVISFDVPGIDQEDLDISLSGSTILVNGIRKGSQESSLAYSEIARGTISRAIGVPFDVSPNKAINTSLENGVLKIRIAKDGIQEKKMTARKVKIG